MNEEKEVQPLIEYECQVRGESYEDCMEKAKFSAGEYFGGSEMEYYLHHAEGRLTDIEERNGIVGYTMRALFCTTKPHFLAQRILRR